MKRILIGLLAIILLSGCSASKLVKMARKKDPSMFVVETTVVKDTLIIEVPTVVDRVQIDTLVEIVQIDPITKIETIIKYKIQNDTIMIDCPDSETITEVITKTETITLQPTFWEKAQWGLYVGGALLVVAFVIKIIA